MGKLTIGCYPGLVGNMGYDFALKLADAAADQRTQGEHLVFGKCNRFGEGQPETPEGLFDG